MEPNRNAGGVLGEHGKVYNARYIFAIINFIAVFASSIVTLMFVGRRGISDFMHILLYVMAAASGLQVLVYFIDFILQKALGIYTRVLTFLSYGIGLIWLAAFAGEFVLGTLEVSALRIDLLVVLAVQFVIALTAYLVWPFMNRCTLSALMKKNMREGNKADKKRAGKARRQVAVYALFTVLIVLLEAGTLIAYQLPPTFYDLFDDTRALSYRLTEDKEGYVVQGMYLGTSPHVVVPATYNGKPVVGIEKGALVDDGLLEQYKITDIVFGTYTSAEPLGGTHVGDRASVPLASSETADRTNAAGDVSRKLVSNLVYIESGAISGDKIVSLTLPESVERIGIEAVRSNSLQTVVYSCRADFSVSYINCPDLKNIVIEGEKVGKISSIEGLPASCNVTIARDVYNMYRKENIEYASQFRPAISEDEYCIDFYSGCDVYIESIICSRQTECRLSVGDLKSADGRSLAVDTLAYIADKREIGTQGAKPDSAFRGWYTDSAFGEECAFRATGELIFTKDTSLYAKWVDEYTATLDWGTYLPKSSEIEWDETDDYHEASGDSLLNTVYFTDDHAVDFPRVSGRTGYGEGVRWAIKEGDYVTRSAGISKSLNLRGEWQLDLPTVAIDTSGRQGDGFTISGNDITFEYDYADGPKRYMNLAPQVSHPLNVTYTYTWYRDGAVTQSNMDHYVLITDVAHSGEYKLSVEAKSATGETSVATSSSVTITVQKKQIEVEVGFPSEKVEYNGESHGIELLDLPEDFYDKYSVKYFYEEMDANGAYVPAPLTQGGVVNVNTYQVTATISRIDAYGANFSEKIRHANFEITPREITIRWQNAGTYTYNGKVQHPTVLIENDVSVDGQLLLSSSFRYTQATLSSVDVGEYTAEIAFDNGINKNLVLSKSSSRTAEYSIEPYQITASTWTLRTDAAPLQGNTVTYCAKPVSALATPDFGTVEEADAAKLKFSYTDSSEQTETAAGSYTVTIKELVDGNGNPDRNYVLKAGDQNNTFSWTISPKVLTAARPDDRVYTYNADFQKLGLIITGFCGADAQATDSTKFGGTFKGFEANGTEGYLYISQKDAGPYEAELTGFDNGNYQLRGADTYNFEIEKKQLTVDYGVKKTVTYRGEPIERVITVNGFEGGEESSCALGHFVLESDFATKIGSAVSGGYRMTFGATNAGEYRAVVTGLGEIELMKNYCWQESEQGKAELTVKPLVVELEWFITNEAVAGGKPQETDEPLPKAEYNGYPYTMSASIANLCGEDEVLVGYDKNSATAADSHVFTVNGLSGKDSGNYTTANAEALSRTLTITPKVVGLTWFVEHGGKVKELAESVIYDKTAYIVTATVSGTCLSDEVTVTKYSTSILEWYADPVIPADHSATNAGVYRFTATALDDPNYCLSQDPSKNSGTLTINRLTVVWIWEMQNVELNGGAAVAYEPSAVYNGKKYFLTARVANAAVRDEVFPVYASGAQTALHAKTYRFTVSELSGKDHGNYTLTGAADNSKSFTVNPKGVKPVWEDKEVTYNGETHALNATIAGLCGEDSTTVRYSGGISVNYGLSAITQNSARHAGEYVVTATGLGNSDYVLDCAKDDLTRTLKILPKEVTIDWSGTDGNTGENGEMSFIYSAERQHPAATVQGAVQPESLGVTYRSEDFITVGTYTAEVISLTGKTAANYRLTGTLTKEFTIEQRPVAIIWSEIQPYNGEIQHPAVISVTNDTTGAANGTLFSAITGYTGDTQAKTHGTYTVTVTFSETVRDNYIIEDASRTFTIQKRIVTLSWSGQQSVVYNGQPNVLTATVTNVCTANGDQVDVVYTAAGNSYTQARSEAYTVAVQSLSGTNSENYTVEGAADLIRTLTVSPKTASLVWYLDDSAYTGGSIVYDTNMHRLTARVGNLCGEDTAMVYYTSGNEWTNAGSYTVEVSGISDPNYAVPNANTASLNILKAEANISWQVIFGSSSKEIKSDYLVAYNKIDHRLQPTVTGVDGAAIIPLLSGDTGSYRDAGTYKLTVSLSDEDAKNYNFATSSAPTRSLIIAQKAVTLSWDEQKENVYNGTQYTRTATIEGLVDGDTDVTLGYELTRTSNYGQTSGTNGAKRAGEYLVTAMLNHKNYKLSSDATTTAELVIKPKTVSFVWYLGNGVYTAQSVIYTGQSVVYDRTNHTLSAKFADGVLVGDDNVTINHDAVSFSAAGTHTVRILGLSGTNYTDYALPSDTQNSFTITPKPIGAQWSVGEYTYNGSEQHPTAQLTGVESGDYVSPVYQRTDFTDAEKYTIELSGVDNGNYQLDGSYSKAFEIKPRPFMGEWGNTQFIYSGKAQRPTLSLGVSGLTVVYSSQGEINAGTYSVHAAISDKNYILTNDLCSYQILPRTLTMSWKVGSYIFNGREQYPTAQLSGIIGNDSVSPVYKTTNFIDAGEYVIELTGVDNGNYQTAAESRSFVIEKQILQATWAGAGITFAYMGAAPDVRIVSLKTAEGNALPSIDFAYTVTDKEGNLSDGAEIGTYTVTAVIDQSFNPDNYGLNLPSAKYTVSPKKVSLSWSAAQFTYAGKTQRPTATANGVLGSDNVTITYQIKNKTTGNLAAGTSVGTYLVTAIFTGSGVNHYTFENVSCTYTISPKQVTAKWNVGDYVYDGNVHYPTAELQGLIGTESPRLVYRPVSGDFINAGLHTVEVSLLNTAVQNYVIEDAQLRYRISQKQVSVQFPSRTEYTYDGTAKSVEIACEGADKSVLTVSGTLTATDVGDYTITVTCENGNYELTGETTFVWHIVAPAPEPPAPEDPSENPDPVEAGGGENA